MAQHKAGSEQLSRDELAMMTAFEAYTGDGTAGVERADLPAALQDELDDFMALTQQITTLDDVPAVDPRIRGLVLSAAVANRDAARTGVVAWLLTLLRPAPMAAIALLAAVLVAVGVRPTAHRADAEKSGSAMVAMRSADAPDVPNAGARSGAPEPPAAGALVAAEERPAADRPEPETPATARGVVNVAAATKPIVTPRTDVAAAAKTAKKTTKKKVRRRLFAAQPASLGPTDGVRPRNVATAHAKTPPRETRHNTTATAEASPPRRQRNRLARVADFAGNAANTDELSDVQPRAQPADDGLAQATNYAHASRERSAHKARAVASKKSLESLDKLRAGRATRTPPIVSAAGARAAPVAAAKPAARPTAPTKAMMRPAPTAGRARPAAAAQPQATQPKTRAVDDDVLTLRKRALAATSTSGKRAALHKLLKIAQRRGLKRTAIWATQQLASLDAADTKRAAAKKAAAARRTNKAPAKSGTSQSTTAKRPATGDAQ